MQSAITHPLSPVWRRTLLAARLGIFLIALSIALWGAFRLFFPISVAIFNFDKPGSLANTFSNPRNENGLSLANGQLDHDQTIVTTVGLNGGFSALHVALTPSRKSLDPTSTIVSVRRSFTGFFFPVDPAPATFPVGTLLTSESRYAIIDADGERIDFDSLETVKALGYNPDAFIAVSPEEFNLNKKSETLLWHPYSEKSARQTKQPPSTEKPKSLIEYPTGTLFVIDGTYYQLQTSQSAETDPIPFHPRTLARFVSENAYLSRYEKNQAIQKTADFLKDFTLAENWIGFASGTLLSFGDGIFAVNGEELQPIGDPVIFVALGFDWNRVIPASEEELGIYQRGKLIVQSSQQPEGTLFADRDTGQIFVTTAHQTRQLVPGRALQSLLLRHTTPISASSQALTQSTTCRLQPSGFFWDRTFDCDATLEPLVSAPGNAYELTLHAPQAGLRLNALEGRFSTFVRSETFRGTLSRLKQQILNRYAQQQ